MIHGREIGTTRIASYWLTGYLVDAGWLAQQARVTGTKKPM